MYVKAAAQHDPFQMEQRLRRHDGEYRWVVSTGAPRFDADGSFAGYIGTAVDITERKRAEEALSTVSQKLIEAHEEERARIACELHDDISQRLGLVIMHLDSLKQNEPSAAIFEGEISAVRHQLTEHASDVQGLSHRLHSPRLELLGLGAAAAAFCEELSNRHGVKIDIHFENVPDALPSEIALCVYRVLQEALQNVVKHSESPYAHVSLEGHSNDISLKVEDSGPGFEPHQAMRGPGLGLTSMRERLKVVGGQLFVRSERGRGTMIHAVVPRRLPTKSTSVRGSTAARDSKITERCNQA
jgi:signal transduction histidine kinase